MPTPLNSIHVKIIPDQTFFFFGGGEGRNRPLWVFGVHGAYMYVYIPILLDPLAYIHNYRVRNATYYLLGVQKQTMTKIGHSLAESIQIPHLAQLH